ncbi:MAG: hypothetical protein ACYCX3_06650 [Thermoleophilia bacterium]
MTILGHLEFDWHEDLFAVVPSCAAFVSGTSGCLVLTGARPLGFLENVLGYCESDACEVDCCPHGPVYQPGGPFCLLLEIEVDHMALLCHDLAFQLSIHPGKAILEELPIADLENVGQESHPDDRFASFWLDPERLRRSRPPNDGEGLWHVDEYRRKVAYVRHEGVWTMIPEREYGPYIAYPEQTYLRFREQARELLVFDGAPLPALVARTASLRTGLLPVGCPHSPGWHVYHNIDSELKDLIALHLSAGVDEE